MINRKLFVLKQIIFIFILLIKVPFVMAIEVTISSAKASMKADLPEASECYVSQVVWENLSLFFPQSIQQGRGLTIINNVDGSFFVRLSKSSDNYFLGNDGLYHCTCCHNSYTYAGSATGHSYVHPGHHLYCPSCECLYTNQRFFHQHLKDCNLRHITSGSR